MAFPMQQPEQPEASRHGAAQTQTAIYLYLERAEAHQPAAQCARSRKYGAERRQ